MYPLFLLCPWACLSSRGIGGEKGLYPLLPPTDTSEWQDLET